MKIAFVVERFPTVAQTPILNMITGLIDLGHNVDIFSFARGDTSIIQADIQKYRLLERVVYLDPLSRVSDQIREARMVLDEKISKKIALDLSSLNLFRFFRNVIVLIKLIYSSRLKGMGRYDIVHC